MTKSKKTISKESVSYLLTEYQASQDGRRDLELLIDREVQYFFALFGIIGVTSGIVIQVGTNAIISLGVIIVLSGLILIAGYRLLRRITVMSGLLTMYEAQKYLIRRFFVEKDNSLENFIVLPIASKESPAHPFKPMSKQISLILIPIGNVILQIIFLNLISVIIYYLINDWVKSIWFWYIGFGLIFAISIIMGIIFYRHQKSFIINMGDMFSNHVTKLTHTKLHKIENNEKD